MMSLFCVAVILGTVLVLNRKTVPAVGRPEIKAPLQPAVARAGSAPSRPVPAVDFPSPSGPAVDNTSISPSDISIGNDVDYLKRKNLLIPVAGIRSGQLHDSFADQRSDGRQHQAIDIPAPSGTPVLAATEGKILKLFHSDKGGITLYESDPSGPFVYYYAHLSGYAPNISEGAQVNQGDTIAYVGDTGNAGTGNFHLHFAISKLAPGDRWSGGTPINPYPILSVK